MENLLDLIREYGTLIYIILFAYCALKSGSLPLFGGYAAQAGALDVALVMTATFAGGYMGDEVRFAVARRYGTGFLASRPRLSALMDKAGLMMDRYGAAYIFLYRYPKGLRTIGALPVGLSDMPWQKFSLFNFASAAVWAGFLVGAGYFFGAAIEEGVANGWSAVSLILLALFIGASIVAWRRLSTVGRQAGET